MRVAAVSCVILFMVSGLDSASAQTPPPNTDPTAATTENSRLSRQLDRRRAAEKKAKRLDCERQAKEQNLHLAKRVRFIRQCMAGA
jgi:hypothetical protein